MNGFITSNGTSSNTISSLVYLGEFKYANASYTLPYNVKKIIPIGARYNGSDNYAMYISPKPIGNYEGATYTVHYAVGMTASIFISLANQNRIELAMNTSMDSTFISFIGEV